jgi:imidazolonepropionase-like amidohydrolase
VLFEGARLFAGDGSAVIPNAAFIVEDGRFTAVGRAGDLDVPEGAARVDLSGKTVIPALIDLHAHPGYLDVAAMTDGPENYDRENLVDHLRRAAYYGVGVTLSLGLDRGGLEYELAEEVIPGASRLFTVGSGIAMPNGGPGAEERRDAAYGVTTGEEARAAVRELAALEPEMVKIWVDARGGAVDKLTADLYRAVIDEAHVQGLRVIAHINELEDTKELLRAGIDGFAHGVQATDIDDELLSMMAERPEIFVLANLPANGLASEQDLAYIAETIPPAEVENLRAGITGEPNESFEIQARNIARMHAAGITIGFATDGNGAGWDAHEELADMVSAGLTPGQALEAATGISAAILGLDDVGTVATGSSADFVVLDADPLVDIANTRLISGVYLRGEVVDREALRTLWMGE